MLVIVKGRPIEIDWYIFKGANKQAEDFSQLDAGSIKVFLIGPSNKGDDQISRFNRFTYEVNVATDDNNKQYLKIDIDDTASALLDTGIYDIKVVWVKNSELHLGIREGNQHLSESRLSGIFAITADSSEDNTRLDSGVTAKKILRSFVEPTGYDGLSAYEIAVMHGYTEDEQTWAEEFTEAEERVDYEMDETKAGDGSTTRDDEKHIPVEEWVHESWAHKVEVTWQGNESTRQSNELTRQDNEDTRKTNEGIGTTDAECAAGSRRKNESIRVSNESTRQSQEGTRQDNETTRGQKETARQKAEGQLGDTDPDYATSRVKKELDRQSAESTRISNEEGRVAAEGSVEGQTGRAYAESVRVSNESTRQSNEGSRGTAETARQKAEGQLGSSDPDYATSRIKQELDRQTAEAARELAETARENAKISSTTIEYAVGDSGTTAPVSGWQSTIPSYTTGDFLWGRTTITFGDGTSKVLYAIGSVPNVSVSQNASTGKTTITVGSDSYDVATEPVSVSQNTSTTNIQIGLQNNIIDTPIKSSDSEVAIDIADENGYVVERLQNGELKTKNFDSLKTPAINDSLIGLDTLEVSDESDNVTLIIRQGHIKTKNFDSSTLLKFRDYSVENVRFQVPVNVVFLKDTPSSGALQDTDSEYYDNGVLMLPESYTSSGKPTRLVIGCHGAGGGTSDHDSQTEQQTVYKYLVANGYAVMDMQGMPSDWVETWWDDCTSPYKDYIKVTNLGSPLAVECYIKGYQWVIEHYNIDRSGVMLCGGSMGGLSSTNLLMSGGVPVLAHAIFAPVLDLYNQAFLDPWHVGVTDYTMGKLYGFEKDGNGNWIYSAEKVNGYNPIVTRTQSFAQGLRVTSVGTYNFTNKKLNGEDVTEYKSYPCPLKIWHCENDGIKIGQSERQITAIKNAGGMAWLRKFPTGGHDPQTAGDIVTNPSGNTILKGASVGTIYPLDEEMLLYFNRFNKQ